MAFSFLVMAAASLAAAASAAVVAPQPQPSPAFASYYLAQPAAPSVVGGYAQQQQAAVPSAGYFYAPVVTPAEAYVLDPSSGSLVGGQQQQDARQQQQQQALAFRATEGRTDPYQLGTARLFINPLTGTFTTSWSQLLTDALSKSTSSVPIIAKADIYKYDGSVATQPAAAIIGTVFFYQKTSTSNLNVIASFGFSDGTAITAGTTRLLQVWTGTVPSTGNRCAIASQGAVSSTLSSTVVYVTGGAAAPFANSVSGSASVPYTTATLYGSSSIIGKSVRINPLATTDAGPDVFCGNIVQL